MQFFLNIKFLISFWLFFVLHGAEENDRSDESSVVTVLRFYAKPPELAKYNLSKIENTQHIPTGYVSSRSLHLFKVSEFCQRASFLIRATLQFQKLANVEITEKNIGEVIANYTSLISTAKEVLSQWPKCQGVEKQAAQLQYCLMDLYLGIAYTFSRYSYKCDEQFAYALAVCEFLQTLPHKYVRDAYVIPISRGDKDCTLDRDVKASFAKSLLKDFLSKYMSENKNYKAHMAISTVIMSSALPSAEKCEFARHLDECLRR